MLRVDQRVDRRNKKTEINIFEVTDVKSCTLHKLRKLAKKLDEASWNVVINIVRRARRGFGETKCEWNCFIKAEGTQDAGEIWISSKILECSGGNFRILVTCLQVEEWNLPVNVGEIKGYWDARLWIHSLSSFSTYFIASPIIYNCCFPTLPLLLPTLLALLILGPNLPRLC